jgi:membrane dipeptidase
MPNKKILYYLFILLFFFQCYSCSNSDSKQDRNTTAGGKDSNITKPDTVKIQLYDPLMNTTNKFNNLDEDAFDLHYDAIVIDTHNDILMPIKLEGADITREMPSTQSDLVKWRKGGLDMQVFSIYVPEKIHSNHFKYAIGLIDDLEELSSNNPNVFRLAHNYDELADALKNGIFCGLMGVEGGDIIGSSIENLETLHERGIKYIGLTWNTSNAIGVSAKDETERGKKGGLTEFGKEVVEKMDELGILIDVSHLGETAFWDVVNMSKNPIIASHSAVYNICPHFRNLTDEQIQAIAKSGGYIGVNFYSKFLDPGGSNGSVIQARYKQDLKEIEETSTDMVDFNKKRYEYLKEHPAKGGTSIDYLIDHIDYIAKLVGVDYVGLGSDFDGAIFTPNELYDATCYPIITKKLVERGYKEDEIRKILGLNFLRVFKRVCG